MKKFCYDNLTGGGNDNQKYVVRASGGRYCAETLVFAKNYVGVESIFTIKSWGPKGFK